MPMMAPADAEAQPRPSCRERGRQDELGEELALGRRERDAHVDELLRDLRTPLAVLISTGRSRAGSR